MRRNRPPHLASVLLGIPLLLAAPASAVEVVAKSTIFTDFSTQLSASKAFHAGHSAFNVSRARLDLNAKFSPDLKGRVTTDIRQNGDFGMASLLRYAYLDYRTPIGRFWFGQVNTGWGSPVEESWWPFRLQGGMFSDREGLIPSDDRGLSWLQEHGNWQYGLAIHNGEGGRGIERIGTKAYTMILRHQPFAPLDLGMVARRHVETPTQTTDTILAGGNLDLGWIVCGGEGAYKGKSSVGGPVQTGLGGSAHVYVPMWLTPTLRLDYFDEDTSAPQSAAHLRSIVGLNYTLAPGVELMLAEEHVTYLKDPARPAEDIIGLYSKTVF